MVASTKGEPGALGRLLDAWAAGRPELSLSTYRAGVGRAVGVSRGNVADWWRGATRPHAGHLRALANHTGIPYVELLKAADQDEQARRGSVQAKPDLAIYVDGQLVAVVQIKQVSDRPLPRGRLDLAWQNRVLADDVIRAKAIDDEEAMARALDALVEAELRADSAPVKESLPTLDPLGSRAPASESHR